MTEPDETTIDGWRCVELWPGTDWTMRTATRGPVQFSACADGLDVEETYSGYSGASGRYIITANVFMWLAQAVRL